ncbi:glycosyltransferase [Alkalinema sp. FACHB-956]|uniref:glycosyltransferase n=1 Tax=Alkalinema sp. FACHB-956 TaxID=2692768 RepID=UPI0016884514|nr:glycosyltransferase [Alkalinema sp. FACHB-956]MBD2325462.1 glycosyltransferase [Alkalinema sp. FACHB-956]
MEFIWIGISLISLVIWIYLLCFRGQFWRTNQQLPDRSSHRFDRAPSIAVVIPARNEADVLPISLRSLLTQNYDATQLTIVLVDDHSEDGTADVARQIAETVDKTEQLQVIAAAPLPKGWTGKLWALEQGVNHAIAHHNPDYLLLTDADIEHAPDNLKQLVAHAITDDRELVSLMVKLRCKSFWEKLLIPAFVFFFAKLYPFAWVNHPNHRLGAAAGGCILVKRQAIERIGGIAAIHNALIDDCTLGQTIKKTGTHRIWLGLTNTTYSLRPYDTLKTIWTMVARTAYTQLNYSPLLLLGTLIGMFFVYLVPITGMIIGLLSGSAIVAIVSLLPYLLMTIAYFPTVRFYQCNPTWSLSLPAIAFLYTLMTIDSAMQHWQGKGGQWKGRTY